LSVRPEKIAIETAPRHDLPNRHAGTVEFVSYLGSVTDYHVRLASGETLMVQDANRVVGAGGEIALGQRVHLAWPAEACLMLPDEEAVAEAPGADAARR
jgi:putrescine transport system ATP-binding protein